MKTPVYTGAGTALITPFLNGGIDFEAYKSLIEFQIKNGVGAIITCGTTGEASTLTDDEHKKLIEFTVKQVAGRVKVIAGTGSNDTDYSLMLSKHAKDAGADALLQVTPYYNKTSQKGLVKHFTLIADAVDIPMILYNVPSRTNLNILPQTYKILSEHPNINAVKEANGNIASVVESMALCGGNLAFYSGNDADILPIMALGGAGVISTVANIIPKEISLLCKYCLSGNFKRAAELQKSYIDLINAVFVDVNPIPIKAAANLLGMCGGDLRLPLCEIDENNLAVLAGALKNHGLLQQL